MGFLQNHPKFGQKEQNLQEIDHIIINQDVKADLLVLPELFATGYAFQNKLEMEEMAENTNGITAHYLHQWAKKIEGVVVAGFIEKDQNHYYNAALVISPAGFIGTYRKIHLFYKEKLWFSPGNRPFSLFQIDDLKLGVMICFDWIFPESARSLALLGADIIAHPANLVLPYCQKAMTTRCLSNRVFAITANRVGTEQRGVDNFTFTGQSQITSFNGDILASGSITEEDLKIMEINLKLAQNKNLNEFNNVHEDLHPELYTLK